MCVHLNLKLKSQCMYIISSSKLQIHLKLKLKNSNVHKLLKCRFTNYSNRTSFKLQIHLKLSNVSSQIIQM